MESNCDFLPRPRNLSCTEKAYACALFIVRCRWAAAAAARGDGPGVADKSS
jgi:hypothetical protein